MDITSKNANEKKIELSCAGCCADSNYIQSVEDLLDKLSVAEKETNDAWEEIFEELNKIGKEITEKTGKQIKPLSLTSFTKTKSKT